jgi:microcystin-dependent protein
MSTEPYIGQISMVGFNWAPRGWALCNGQLIAIQQNTALFSLLGTTYGGNGQTTFALPNLQGRVPMHWGTGAGLTPRVIGEMAGEEAVTLISTQMPMHNHSLNVSSEDAGIKNPSGQVLATTTTPAYVAGPIDGTMNPQAIGMAGGNLPHDNMQPYLAISFIIALQGIFPSRN